MPQKVERKPIGYRPDPEIRAVLRGLAYTRETSIQRVIDDLLRKALKLPQPQKENGK